MKHKCPLCKMLNVIAELKKHPSEQGFFTLVHEFEGFAERHEGTADTCDHHRLPMHLIYDTRSVNDFIVEVRGRPMGLVSGRTSVRNYEAGKRFIMDRR